MDALFCPVGGNGVMGEVAKVLGKSVEEKAPMISVLRCGGGHGKREIINRYDGMATCAAAAALYDGNTGCSYGCLMLGDCARACSFGGVRMDEQTGLPVVNESMCTACGACIKACPKGLLEARNKGPKGRRIYVSCLNREKGAVARKACQVACIGCSKCVKACAFEAITFENYLAYIDFNRCKLCRKCVTECPTGAIVEVNFPPKKASILPVEPNDNPVNS
jgi:ferredoxin